LAPLLILATLVAYLPATRGGFVWDDDTQIVADPLLRSAEGLGRIWTRVGPVRGGTDQYYPLTFSVFWLEYHFWQLKPLGYHLVNILLHALNAVVFWRILEYLEAPGALLAAAIFALHPVHVESVAWVIELKNVLSGQFYLLSLFCFLRFWNKGNVPNGSRAFYYLANALFLCALSAKTATVGLPLVILLIIWWKTGRVGWKQLRLVSPMLAMSAFGGLLTTWVEKYQAGADGYAWTLTFKEHFLLAGKILWFYIGKLAWPRNLTFVYPRWNAASADWHWHVLMLSAIVVPVLLWSLREKIGRGPLAAVLAYGVTIAPVMGFFHVYFMRFSYVADHFQYLASLWLIALFAAAATRFFNQALLLAALLPLLGATTWRQAKTYRDLDTLWGDVLEKNPTSYIAHNNMGSILLARGDALGAIRHYSLALQSHPELALTHYNLGLALAGQEKLDEAIRQYDLALETQPDYPAARDGLGVALSRQGKIDEAIQQYALALRSQPDFVSSRINMGAALAAQGKNEAAIRQYTLALSAQPDSASAHNDIGVALAAQDKVDAAIRQYRLALEAQPEYADAHYNLGLALAWEGKNDLAIWHFRRTLQINPAYGPARDKLAVLLKQRAGK
jgi:tetratricopeptide (TPR) repeat protein